MTTPIIMLVLMMAPYLVVRIVSAVTRRDFDVRGAAAIGLGIFSFSRVSDTSSKRNPWRRCCLPGSLNRCFSCT